MKSELTLAFNELAEHTHLSHDVILEAIQDALVAAYRRATNISTAQYVEIKVDLVHGGLNVYAEKEVVDETQDERTEVTLRKAREVNPEAELGDMVVVDSTPRDFGRIAAQTAKQVILQRIREAEREAQYQEYIDREGDIVHGTVQSVNSQAVTIGLGRAEALMPRNQLMPNERYRPHDKVRAFVLEVRRSPRGPQIIVSRTHKNMLRRLLEMEVPEIYNGLIEIKSIAREPGYRSKVAVSARQEGVDPVGACVGMRGVRIQSIVRELNDEKIDVIEWNPDAGQFIAKALSPARVSGVYLDDDPQNRTATVIVPDDQLSLAIGREGQNARLAAKLTGWRIDIKGVTEAAIEVVQLLTSDESMASLVAKHTALIEKVSASLERKQENKPIAPEEFSLMEKLVHFVETERIEQLSEERTHRLAALKAVRETIPPMAYQIPLDESGLAEKFLTLLEESDLTTAGDVMETLTLNPDKILALEGVGPKVIQNLEQALNEIEWPEPETPPIDEAVAEVDEAEEATTESDVPTETEEPAPMDTETAQPTPETDETEETVPETEEVAEAAPVAETPTGEPETKPEEAKPDDIFSADQIELPDIELEEDEDEDDDELPRPGKKKKKKKKKKGRTIIYDEELGQYVAIKKRKPGRSRWRWDDELGYGDE